MFKKLAGYTFISLLSFCVFSLFLNTAASAKGSGSGIFAPLLAKTTNKSATPTPPPPIAVLIPTKPPSDPSPSQATSPTPTTAPTAAPTSAPAPTATPTPTSSPTDTPTPTTTPTPTPTPDLEALFTQYSGQYSVDKNLLENIAQCESGKNPNASNLSYLGMFQFGPDSWSSIRTTMNLDPNPELRTNAEESIKTAAYLISIGRQSTSWPNCPKP